MSERHVVRISEEAKEAVNEIIVEKGKVPADAIDWLILKGLQKFKAEQKYQAKLGPKKEKAPKAKKEPAQAKPRAKKEKPAVAIPDANLISAAKDLLAQGFNKTLAAKTLGMSKDQLYRLLKK